MKRLLAFSLILGLAFQAKAVVTSSTNTVTYTGNGSTRAFPITFKVLSVADITVTVNGVGKINPTDYTVTLLTNSGTVNFVVAPVTSSVVKIVRLRPLTQTQPYRSQGPLNLTTLENSFDDLEMQIQQLASGFFNATNGVVATCTGDICTAITATGHNGGIAGVFHGADDDGHFGPGDGIVATGGRNANSGNTSAVGGRFTGGADDGINGPGAAIVATGGTPSGGGGAPAAELHGTSAKSSLTLMPQAVPTTHAEGDTYYDTTKHSLLIWTGSQWVDSTFFKTFNLPMPLSFYGAAADGTTPDDTALTNCITANAVCLLPKAILAHASTIVPPSGHRFQGQGHASTMLKYTGTGCGSNWDGTDGGGMEGLTVAVTSTAATVRGVCIGNATGPTLWLRFTDIKVIGQSIAGTYGVFVHVTTGNSGSYYTTFMGLITQNWDRGVELLGDVASGGVNAVWFYGYSSNANVVGIYFDNKSGDNYVQMHCNASGTVFAQTCVIIGDGTHTSAGNEVHLVTDTGAAAGTSYFCQAGAVNNIVFSVDEGSGAANIACDSTNLLFNTKASGVAARNVFLPTTIFSGTSTDTTDIFIGQGVRTTGITAAANTNVTVGQHDRVISVTGLTGPHTVTLTANSGQMITIGDADGSCSATNTISIIPPGGGGKINGSASNLVLALAGKSAQCNPLTANALNWSCTVSP